MKGKLSKALLDAEAVFENRRQSRLWCFCVALVMAVLVNGLLILNGDYMGPDDDLGIAMVLSGLYPGADQCLFTNAALNNVIVWLGQLAPDFNWFLVCERLSSTVAYFVLCFVLVSFVPLRVAAPLWVLITYFILPRCTVGANFTVVAAMCVAAGELCFCIGLYRRRWLAFVPGLLLVTLGYAWRALVLVLSAPFLALAFVALLLKCRSESPERCKTMVVQGLLSVAVVGIVVGSAYGYDKAIWSQPEWSSWQDYNNARYELVDYPTRDYEDVKTKLEAIGVSQSDYWLMENWITADPEYITTDKLREVTEIAREPADERSLIGAFADELLRLAKGFLFTACLIAVVVIEWSLGKRAALIALLSVLGAFFACVLFRYTGRLPLRVEYSIWLFSLMPCIAVLLDPVARKHQREADSKRVRTLALALLMSVFCVAGLLVKWLPTFDVARFDQFERSSAYVESNELVRKFTKPGTVFVWDPTSFSQLEVELKYRYLPPESFMDSTTMAGGWTQGSTFMAAHNKELGVSNPLKALVERPDTYFVTRREKAISNVLDYLREHYNGQTRYEIVESVPLPDKEKDPLLVVRYYSE